MNNSRALELEISKQKQYEELKKFNINFPETYYAKNKNEILEKSKNFKKSFITKHNRGGRGLGVNILKIRVNLKNILMEILKIQLMELLYYKNILSLIRK